MRRSRHEMETGLSEPDIVASLDDSTGFAIDQPFIVSEPPRPNLSSQRYEITELIQSGGMGLVYRAHDRLLKREVAVKVLRADRVTKPSAAEEFTKEAYVMAFLPHPGVTPIYETGVCSNGQPFHVMKLLEGVTLRTMLEEGRVETAELLQVFTDVCQTMAFAHSRGVIHLDLKPSNIMVGAFGEVNVMDWGLARSVRPHSGVALGSLLSASDLAPIPWITRQTQVNGTPEYMSPEQARGSTLDARADVFSLGGILCEILSGHAPYEGTSLKQVYHSAVRGKTHPSLERLRNCGLDGALVRLAINCLQIEASQRPADATVLAHVMMAHQASTLRSVQSDMNRFFELSPDMFCIADRNGFFVRINNNFTKVLGHSKETLLAKPFLSFVHNEDQEKTIEQVAALNEGRKVVRFRNRYVTATGDYRTIEWTANAIEGEHLIFAVARDVTVSTS